MNNEAAQGGTAGEVFWVALRLGLTSFGGPVAHLACYERTYVRERQWLTPEQYGRLLAICQLLPGPTSSQVGFLVGLHRAGWMGAAAAWSGFTLPSAILMFMFAVYASAAPGPRMQAVLHGLMLTAVVVVAQAVWHMARTLAPDLPRRLIALASLAGLLYSHDAQAQLLTLIGGAIIGAWSCRDVLTAAAQLPTKYRARVPWISIGLFVALLVGLSCSAQLQLHGPLALASIFYRSGALVFGGGHVVLPLLQVALVPTGWITDDRFLSGYGFAQAMPGPLFTLAAYLGAASAPPHQALVWAGIALAAIFIPGILLAVAGQSILERFSANLTAAAALAGTNAAVVGLLAAALYNPVWVTAVHSAIDVWVVVGAFVLLQRLRFPPLGIAGLCVAAALLTSLIL